MYLRQRIALDSAYDRLRLSNFQTEKKDIEKYDEIIYVVAKTISNNIVKFEEIIMNFRPENKVQNQSKLFAVSATENQPKDKKEIFSELESINKKLISANDQDINKLYDDILKIFYCNESTLNEIANRLKRNKKIFLDAVFRKVNEILKIKKIVEETISFPKGLLQLIGNYL